VRRAAALFASLLVLAACGGGADGGAEAVAREALRKGPFNDPDKVASIGSATERKDCPEARGGPCLSFEVKTEFEARPANGGPAQGMVEATFDAFVWLDKKGERWKVKHVMYRPRGVAVDGVPYSD
jgi:hypothetical protein